MRGQSVAAKKKSAPKRALWIRSKARRLALRELERTAGLGLAVLLTLDHARVAGEEAAALEHAAEIRFEIGQRLGDAVTHGAGLARQTAARHGADDVELGGAVGGDQRLVAQHAQHRPGEEHFNRARVEGELVDAGLVFFA